MNYNSLKELFIAICDAIRYKEGSTDAINHQDIPARIRTLVTSATSVLQRNKRINPLETENTIYPDDGYDGLSSVTVEAIPATYIGSAITKKEAFEYTPGTSDITIDENQYLTGTQTIKGDTDLVSENIKSGVTIFNVEGSYVGNGTEVIPEGYVDTSSDNPVTENDIVLNKEAYVNGVKVVGKLKEQSRYNYFTDAKAVYLSQNGFTENDFGFKIDATTDRVIRAGITDMRFDIAKSEFGTAKSEDVAQGVTFTSENGVKIEGTHVCEGSVNTNVDNPATENDIASGKEAYVNGEKITGNIPVISSAKAYTDVGVGFMDNDIRMYKVIPENTIFNKNVVINFYSDASNFGDADPSKVLKGYTFTSASGLKISGEYELGSGEYSSGDVVKARESSKSFVSGYVSGNISINFSSNVGIDNNGDVVLKSSDTGGISGMTLSSSSTVDNCEELKGKYIVVSTSGSSYVNPYYIPEDATFTYTTQSYNRTFSVDKCNQMFILA